MLLATIEQARVFGKAQVEADDFLITVERRGTCQSEAKGQGSNDSKIEAPSMSLGPSRPLQESADVLASVARARLAARRLKSSLPRGCKSEPTGAPSAQV